ncbi:MAG TPA: serine hydrolase domain-containing protein [Thermoanaerobaculia bacterium]|nr:serine hydrolase domain-containing protein [Thermoanaerobaculia bacterium]
MSQTSMRSVCTSIALLAVLLSGCSHHGTDPTNPRGLAASDDSVERFAAKLDALRQEKKIPGLSVAVVRDGKVILARGFGYADLEAQVPATEDTPYDIASVSKTISGVVAMRLVELGLLDLDRPLSAYQQFAEWCADIQGAESIFFRDFRCGSETMTLRHLLTMTSNGKPGESFFYNPPAFSWASRPMMQAAGKPFSTLVVEHVFNPAGMIRSARRHRNLPLPAEIAADLAKPYRLDENDRFVRADAPPPQGDGAAGGVISTVQDLAKFDLALDQGRLLSPASRAAMFRPNVSSSGATLPYGVGWYVQEHDGRRLLWHSGWWEKAYSALYLKVPEERLTLILLANSEGLWWENPLDKAEVQKSPFAAMFFEHFLGETGD